MQTLRVYGQSDDLVEIDFVDGDVKYAAEFSPSDDETHVLVFSNGSVIRVKYNDDGEGNWGLDVACVPGDTITKVHALDQLVDETNGYSPVLELMFNDGNEVLWAALAGVKRFHFQR